MPKKFDLDTLLIASQNKGKIIEIENLLKDYNIKIRSTEGLNLAEPIEDSATFEGNALIKAKYYSQHTNLPALADDSGVCIKILDGQPGVDSAYWGGEERDFSLAIAKIKKLIAEKLSIDESLLDNNEQYQFDAYFVSVLILYWQDGHYETVRGEVHGKIVFPKRGDMGFGYDPIFIPNGANKTFAEMDNNEKKLFSHRGKAFEKLVKQIF